MRLKTLNGAPLCGRLDFSERILLNSDECKAFTSADWSDALAIDSTLPLKWRCITTKATHLQTGWSQPYLPGRSVQDEESSPNFAIPNAIESSFVPQLDDTTNIDTTLTLSDTTFETDGFLEQSFIFHDNLLSSQVLPDVRNDAVASSSSFLETSFGTSSFGFGTPSEVEEDILLVQVPSKMATISLGSLPSAHHLRAIYPQTLTPNFICVLMVNPEQREVFVRKGGYKMNLWEVTVADDTRPGFKVTFWIRPLRESNNEQTRTTNLLLQTLGSLKVGNILLLRNIALTSFRDDVYGQSLNPAISRARTSIDVLMNNLGGSVGPSSGLPAAAVDTFARVKKWARTHVAAESVAPRKRKGDTLRGDRYSRRSCRSHDHDNSLPPDTMESV